MDESLTFEYSSNAMPVCVCLRCNSHCCCQEPVLQHLSQPAVLRLPCLQGWAATEIPPGGFKDAPHNSGMQPLLDAIVQHVPAPGDSWLPGWLVCSSILLLLMLCWCSASLTAGALLLARCA